MANSKFEYVKHYEHASVLLPETYIVVRLDGRGFHKFAKRYKFEKPNDRRSLGLMNEAAAAVMRDFTEIRLAYGVSDEFSFVFDRSSKVFGRRERFENAPVLFDLTHDQSKILSTVVSLFTSFYTFLWPHYFPSLPLLPPLPSFDGRIALYPSTNSVRDYLSWRQADCHINNLFNTSFWALIKQGGMTSDEAEKLLKGTLASDKNEILFSRFGINYNDEPQIFRKGSIVWKSAHTAAGGKLHATMQVSGTDPSSPKAAPNSKDLTSDASEPQLPLADKSIVVEHCDIIGESFWQDRPFLLPST